MNNPTITAHNLSEQLAETLPCDLLVGLSDEHLLQTTGAIEHLGRLVDALRVTAAAEIGHRSRRELGTTSLSTLKGCRNGVELLERVTLISGHTARTRLALGEQLRQRYSLLGELLPARFPAVTEALTAGVLGVDAAAAIVATLLPAVPNAGAEKVGLAEVHLVAAAAGTGPDTPIPDAADDIRRQAQVWQTVLDEDGPVPVEERAMAKRGFGHGIPQDGLVVGRYALMPEVHAAMERVFDAYIATRTAPSFMTDDEHAAQLRESDPRTNAQQRHDVFASMVGTFAQSGLPPTIGGDPPTVLVSVRAEDLESGHGAGHIDGLTLPVSIRTVKQYICTGGTQLVVMAENGAIVALGTQQRLFNRQQRRAINLRDGTCVIPGCTIPASWTEIHHVLPDSEGGLTHTNNGVSLCWFHHHTIDTAGWQLRMINGAPFVKAPTWLEKTPAWRPTRAGPTHSTRALEQGFTPTASPGAPRIVGQPVTTPVGKLGTMPFGQPAAKPTRRPEARPGGQGSTGSSGQGPTKPSGQPSQGRYSPRRTKPADARPADARPAEQPESRPSGHLPP